MLVLVLDCATPAVTAALAPIGAGPARTVEILAKRRTVDGRTHGELLAPHIAEVLGAAGVAPAELAAVVAGLGPGPFTGLRVGLVTAAALTRREVYWAEYTDGTRRSGPAVDPPARVRTGAPGVRKAVLR